MAYWNYIDKKIHYSPAKRWQGEWLQVDCGCSGGLCWGGEGPSECQHCKGNGVIYWHETSKVFAVYPGGPFTGKGELSELEKKGGKYETLYLRHLPKD